VGRFCIRGVLGEGAQGIVYRGEHVALRYPVAIKIIHRDADPQIDGARRARFRREALLAAAVRHRHIVRVLEAGELSDGSPYLVMEHVEGVSLADLLDRRLLGPAAAVELGVQLLAALAALSEQGVLHRDIKPENVMLERELDGHVAAKLLDFGICKSSRVELESGTLTRAGTIVGTPYYMSPEHVRGQALDVRSDLYAAAGVLYECLTGAPPHDGPTTGAIFAAIATEAVRPLRERAPSCPEAIARVVDRGLRASRDERWAHPLEMAEALRLAGQDLALPRGPDAWREHFEVAVGDSRGRRPRDTAPTQTVSMEVFVDASSGFARARSFARAAIAWVAAWLAFLHARTSRRERAKSGVAVALRGASSSAAAALSGSGRAVGAALVRAAAILARGLRAGGSRVCALLAGAVGILAWGWRGSGCHVRQRLRGAHRRLATARRTAGSRLRRAASGAGALLRSGWRALGRTLWAAAAAAAWGRHRAARRRRRLAERANGAGRKRRAGAARDRLARGARAGSAS
jgi:serine/threonine-protein kinase